MARLRSPALLATIALVGCLGSDSPSDPTGGFLPFQTVYQAQASGIDDTRVQTISSAADWAAAWQEIHRRTSEPPPLPAVDFVAQRLLLAAAGSRPNGCYALEVESIVRRGPVLEATLVETVAVAGCVCTQAITQPLHVVASRRAEEPFVARTVQRAASC